MQTKEIEMTTLPELAAQTMSDAALIELADEYVGRLSYYAAAEGEMYARERDVRHRCTVEARPIRAEMRRRGLQCTRPGLVGMD